MKSDTRYFWVVLAAGAVIGSVVTLVVRLWVGPAGAAHVQLWAAPVVASGALAMALLTYAFNWKKSKTDLFNSIHEKLIDPDTQRGRRLLKELNTYSAVERLDKKDFECVNRSLALYATLAMYYSNKSVDRESVISAWGRAIFERRKQIRTFISYRLENDKYESWPLLTELVAATEKKFAK